LQADDIGAEFAQHRGDALGVVSSIDADAAMNVVSRDHEPAGARNRPDGATPPTDHRLTSAVASLARSSNRIGIAGSESSAAMLLLLRLARKAPCTLGGDSQHRWLGPGVVHRAAPWQTCGQQEALTIERGK